MRYEHTTDEGEKFIYDDTDITIVFTGSTLETKGEIKHYLYHKGETQIRIPKERMKEIL